MRHPTCSAQQSPFGSVPRTRILPVAAAALTGLLSFIPSVAFAAPVERPTPAITARGVDYGSHEHLELPITLGSGFQAVSTALDQVGKPYLWGADGPSSYDCSGLVIYAWSRAGRELPHSSRALYRSSYSVSRVEARAGDLVFFGHPVHHVGIYIGNGRMVEAPRRGLSVRVSTIDRKSFAGIRRVA